MRHRRLLPAALWRVWAVALIALGYAGIAGASDPPHDASRSIECLTCHVTHDAPGGAITTVAGNANLCLSCHVIGGQATAKPFVDADQALPWFGLPTGISPAGTSHRWDSGASGHAEPEATNISSGTVVSGGAFTGYYAKTYTLTITTAGDAGGAVFSWTDTLGGGATGVTTGTDVPLGEGITVSFLDGASTPSFALNDQWRIYVRPDINQPTDPEMAKRLEGDKNMCSTCHDQHSQLKAPFDPAAPAYGGPGTGEGRHHQRMDNDTNQMCVDCHSARDVTQSSQGSHPVGVGIPGGTKYQTPASLPLDPSNQVVCMSCHGVHYTATADGSLARMSDVTALCTDCHTLADKATPAAHVDATLPATLWPGGQYGTTYPAVTDASRQGACSNCHQPHGWPDTSSPSQDYPVLTVELEENLCGTCHDGSPVSPDMMAEFTKASAHPLGLASGTHDPSEPAVVSARHVECMDCHNTHQAKPRISLPGPSTSPRPASGPLAEVRGVDVAGAQVDPAAYEYEVCFRCHGDSPGKPPAPTSRQFPQTNVRLEFDGSYPSYHPVTTTGKNPDVPSLIGGWTTGSIMACTDCHNNDDGPANGGTGPNGPHGSGLPTLLERTYETTDNLNFNEANFQLCFKCHDYQNSIRQDESFSKHRKHIEGQRTPCNVCHDPHASEGNPKLINFDTSVVTPFNGVIEYQSTGQFRGYCTLECHRKKHNKQTYKP